LNRIRGRSPVSDRGKTPEGPYEVLDEPPASWAADLEMLRVIDFAGQFQQACQRSLPVSAGGREIGIILLLVGNHFSGRLTTISSLANGSGLTYGTALRAIEEMQEAGFIVQRPRTVSGKTFSLHPSQSLLQRWQNFAQDIRQLGHLAFNHKSGPARPPRSSRRESHAAHVIPPPAALAEKLVLPRGLRVLVHADPTFMVMHALKRQFEMNLGLSIHSKALSIDRLRSEIVANSENRMSQYDIVACDLPWFGDMASRGRLLPLDGFIEQSRLDISDFIPDAVASARSGGRQYGVPVLTTAEILVYRTDLLAEAGIAPPHTIGDTLAAARQLHHPERGINGIAWNGARGTALGHTFMVVMAAHGQPIVDLERTADGFDVEHASGERLRPTFLTQAARDTADFLLELLAVSPPEILSMTWYDRARAYASGSAALAYSHTLLANLFELDASSPANGRTGYLPHPTALDGRPVSPLGGYALAIPANIAPERAPAVWSALCALTSASAAKLYVANGSLASPRFSVNRDPEIASMSPIIGAIDEMARRGVLRMWPRPPVPGISSIINIAGEEIHDMLAGLKSPLEALSAAQNRADTLLRARRLY
jgi:multiple sugar transport system substrate-binding protein